jgi:simple sugar transport system ATP-binding protein
VTVANASGRDAVAALRLAGIHKRFGELWAVRGADLEVRTGAIHAVVGENGAGKSTLLKIAAGILAPDEGEVWTFGERPARYDARRAQAAGVAMVQQHFALFDGLTALENIILGAEPTRAGGRLDLATAAQRAARVFEQLGASVPLHAKVGTLGVGDKQRLEIARVLFRDARVIILDEPTAILTPGEVGTLYLTLRRLASEGRAVVVVTHKLDEVDAHADVVTVMRRGETRGTRPVARGADVARLAGELIGGEPLPGLRAEAGPLGETRLAVRSLVSGRALQGVTLEVRAGEIVGIAGVLGNGQSELIRVLGGVLSADAGEVVAGRIEVVHEDRQTAGLVLDSTVEENVVLGELRQFTHGGLVDDTEVRAAAVARIDRFAIRPADPRLPARALSGGNQQKIVLARALAREPDVLVVAHPTRGVDLVAAHAIHEQILAAAARGTAVLLIGADLTELRCLCRRILVMVRGRIVAAFPPSTDDDTLGAAMLGGKVTAAS